jgi:hypothetical protein
MVQTALTLSVGWRPFVSNAFFVNLSAGVAWLKSVDYQLNVGGSLSDIAGVTGSGQAQFDQKVNDIRSKIDRAVTSYRDNVPFLPTIGLALGYSF